MPDPFALFTRDSQTVLSRARHIVRQANPPLVSSLHLLIGLLDLEGSQVEGVLRELKLRPQLMKAQAQALVKMQAKTGDAPSTIGFKDWRTQLTTDGLAVIEAAQAEAADLGVNFIDTRVLLAGMLRATDNPAGDLLRQYGLALDEFRARARVAEVGAVDLPLVKLPERSTLPPVSLSPIFLGLLAVTAVLGALLYFHIGPPFAVGLLFVLSGSIVCVAVHEFGHALVAYIGGDKSVVEKGYLTLDPTRYVNPFLSIILPLVFLLMGGLPLPGGAVYIDRSAIRGRYMNAFVSAAGPLGTLLCVAVLGLPFTLGWYNSSYEEHFEFWAVLGVLLFVEVAAFFLNLIPIPGLDGFGILEPFLSPNIVAMLAPIRAFSFFLLLLLFRVPGLMSDYFWPAVIQLMVLIERDSLGFALEGLAICLPWLT